MSLNKSIKAIQRKMHERYENYFFKYINDTLPANCKGNKKLKTYKLFKQDYKLEKYLTMKLNKKDIFQMVKFRISSHNLKIEEGRYENKNKNISKIPENQRYCQMCNSGLIEDEKHMLCICITYEHIRTPFFKQVEELNRNFKKNNDSEKKLLELLTTKDDRIIHLTINYINECFLFREIKSLMNHMLNTIEHM